MAQERELNTLCRVFVFLKAQRSIKLKYSNFHSQEIYEMLVQNLNFDEKRNDHFSILVTELLPKHPPNVSNSYSVSNKTSQTSLTLTSLYSV